MVTLTYKRSDHGLFLIEGMTSQGPESFLIDTGATRTAVFADQAGALISQSADAGFANIYGLVNTGQFPMIDLDILGFSDLKLKNLPVAVLPKRENEENEVLPFGLIGMDVLGDYSLLVDANDRLLHLIPARYPQPKLPFEWREVSLYENAEGRGKSALHFFDLRLGNHLLPALLDSGAEFNVMNWDTAIIPTINRLKRRLRKDWEIQGAVGEFDPAVRVKVKGMRAGRMDWGENDFIVMNFEHLKVLGFEDEALVVAGAGLFADKSFYINFTTNQLVFEPHDIPGDPGKIIVEEKPSSRLD